MENIENQEVIIVDNRGLPMMLDANIEIRVMHSRRLTPLAKVVYFHLLSYRYFRWEQEIVEHLSKCNMVPEQEIRDVLNELVSMNVVDKDTLQPLDELTSETVKYLKGARK